MKTLRAWKVGLLATAISFCTAGLAFAQTSQAGSAQLPEDQSQAAPSSEMRMPGPDMMRMMGSEMMKSGTMGEGYPMNMRGQMTKIMFVIADTDGDGALSFEEVTAVHRRIFDHVDANKDGKVTLEEMQAFWQR
ncbi:EF-hand domain-containing protein [Rhizobium sp. YTU87027]|uniref:EF-hand domain-containing protein n=1 Tax=Rhizobium sp. YTU87027 TaxID=3417741 RepID=UPI003D68C890